MTKTVEVDVSTSSFAFTRNEELWITFDPFEVRIVFHKGRTLTVTVTKGANAGFTDTVDYRATALRDGITILSWQEHIGSTVVHVLDFRNKRTLTYITPQKGGFLQLVGKLKGGAG